jgi:hypothetical protein
MSEIVCPVTRTLPARRGAARFGSSNSRATIHPAPAALDRSGVVIAGGPANSFEQTASTVVPGGMASVVMGAAVA